MRHVLLLLPMMAGCEELGGSSNAAACPSAADVPGATDVGFASQSFDGGLAGDEAALNSTHARLFLSRQSWEIQLDGRDDPIPAFDFETGDVILLDLPWIGCNDGGWQVDSVYVDTDAVVHVNATSTAPFEPSCDAFGWAGLLVEVDETDGRDVAVCAPQ